MEETILKLDGVVTKDNGEKFTDKEFFEILVEKGYTFQGSCRLYNIDEMNNRLNYIKENVTEEMLKGMIETLQSNYGGQSRDDLLEFFTLNFGTGIFDKVMMDNLRGELVDIYKHYAHSNWLISDEFESKLGDIIAEKIKEYNLQ